MSRGPFSALLGFWFTVSFFGFGRGIRGEQIFGVWHSDEVHSLAGGASFFVSLGIFSALLGCSFTVSFCWFWALEFEASKFSGFGIPTRSILWREGRRFSCRGAHFRRSWVFGLLFRLAISGVGIRDVRGEPFFGVWNSNNVHSLAGGELFFVSRGPFSALLGFWFTVSFCWFRALEFETSKFSVFGIQTRSILWRQFVVIKAILFRQTIIFRYNYIPHFSICHKVFQYYQFTIFSNLIILKASQSRISNAPIRNSKPHIVVSRLIQQACFCVQIVVDYAMCLQMIEEAANASEQKKTAVVGTWPSTPVGRKAVAVGDWVLYRSSPRQRRGVPGRVTAVTDGLYTVECIDRTIPGVLQGQMLNFTLQTGEGVRCAFGEGVLHSMDEDECEVVVGETKHTVSRYATVPSLEPSTGFKKNPTVNLMRRTCGTELAFVDVFAGESRKTQNKKQWIKTGN